MMPVLAVVCTALLPLLVLAATDKPPSLNEPFQDSFERLSHAPCVTLFHRNGRVGCGTFDRDTQTGKLFYYDGSNPGKNDDYVAVLDEMDLTAEAIENIVSNNQDGKLQGILVLNSTSDDDNERSYQSPEAQAPQGENTPSSALNGDSDYQWNGNGDGLLYYDLYGTPMAYIHSTDVSSTVKAVAQDSDASNSIVAEFNYYMGPDDSHSAGCLSWRDASDDRWRPKCLPVGGTSVWAVAGSPEVADQDDGGQRPVVMVATSMDATSMFHDLSPGANSAASNILTLLMAANLLGKNVPDETLDDLPSRISFAFFQGESYGLVGSRTFLRDVAYPGFECDNGLTVSAVAKEKDNGTLACLHPMRPSLDFQNLGEITGMIAVDQVGVLANDQTLYIHNDGEDGTFGAFLSQVLQASGTNDFSVSASSANADDDGDYPYPPTPLTSLLQLSEGAVGGAVLAGFDDAYANDSLYRSHKDSLKTRSMNLDAVAAAATLLARGALASAYDDGSMDSDAAAEYAVDLIPELSSEDETLVDLSECLYRNGQCDLLRNYAMMERSNDHQVTGLDLGVGQSLGTPPNYYAGVYDVNNGQPFVQVDGSWFGSYTEDDYGKKDSDTFAMRPTSLEMSIRGILNDFLGRRSLSNSDEQNEDSLVSCKSVSDCSDVSYCSKEGDRAVCSGGGYCVCSRAHYHIALDEAIEAAANNKTGLFVVKDDDEGISPIYTEPYWSSSVGVRVYRDAGDGAGWAALTSGLIVASFCVLATLLLKRSMKKEKLY